MAKISPNVDVLSAYIAVAGTAAVISFIVLVTPTFYRVVVVVLHFLRVSASLEIGSMNSAPRVAQCKPGNFGGFCKLCYIPPPKSTPMCRAIVDGKKATS